MKPTFPRPPTSFLLTIFLLTALEFLQSGMVAFAAGPIMGEIGAAPEEFSLATASYACVAIMTISKQRWLVERLGWRRFVQFSLAFFTLGAVICAGSESYRQFLVGRSVMGLGGAAFMTSGRVIINLIPPSPMRFVGIKYFASGLASGIAFAPGFASLAVANDSWNAIFGILAGLALVTGVLATWSLPTDLAPRELRTQSHPVLFMSLASGSFLLLYVLQRSQYDFFSDSTLLAMGLGLAAFALYYYFRAMQRHERPLLELKALKQPRYVIGVGLFTLCYVLLGANNYMLPVLMQRTLGFSWQTVGYFQTLGLLSALAGWFVMAWMLPKWPGAKKFFVVGFLALTGFGWQLSSLNGQADLWSDILPALALNGVFLMLVMATTAMQTFRDVQHNDTVLSNAQQLKNMVAQFGMALGIALATIVLQWRTTEHYGVLNSRFNGSDASYAHLIQQLSGSLAASSGGQPALPLALGQLAQQLSQQLSQQATLMACLDYFTAIAWVGVLGALLMAVQRLMK